MDIFYKNLFKMMMIVYEYYKTDYCKSQVRASLTDMKSYAIMISIDNSGVVIMKKRLSVSELRSQLPLREERSRE